MPARTTLLPVALLAALTGGAALLVAADNGPEIERIDFGERVTATHPAYDARVLPPSSAPIKEFTIPVTHETIEIADGVKYDGWTFGGTVPGPVLRVREGDLVRIKVVNRSPMAHSIDFHSARIPANIAYRSFNPGDSISFEFAARDPGAYLVHCGTPPITMHLMQGMYFAIIVDPKQGWGTKVDREFVLVQSEFYTKADSTKPLPQPDWKAAMDKRASHVVFNGRAGQYRAHPLQVEVGERVRLFVVNAGPSYRSDFHIVGAVFDRVYPDGNPHNVLQKVQTQSIPAGGGAVFETVFERDASGEGLYPFVTHSFADAEKGAVGIIRVGRPGAVTMAH
jgi:nitrite reductase (NO-forming)